MRGELIQHYSVAIVVIFYNVIVIDQFGNNSEKLENITLKTCDMETGLTGIDNSSVKIVVTASALEHLSRTDFR